MKRREFITLIGSAAAALPLAARAQQPERIRRIGALMLFAESDPELRIRLRSFEQALRELGWTAGRNLQIDYRFAAGRTEHLPELAAELGRLAPDVTFVNGTVVLIALAKEISAVPVVFVNVADPVRTGMVASSGASRRSHHRLQPTTSSPWAEVARAAARNRAATRRRPGSCSIPTTLVRPACCGRSRLRRPRSA